MSKLHALRPKDALSPAIILGRALEDIDKIQSVCLILDYKDGTVEVDWSRMDDTMLTYMSTFLQRAVLDEIDLNDGRPPSLQPGPA